MRRADIVRVIRYQRAYPEDKRSSWLILELLNRAKAEKRYLNRWIMRQVHEGLWTEEELRGGRDR